MKNTVTAVAAAVIGIAALFWVLRPGGAERANTESATSSSESGQVGGSQARTLVSEGATLVDVRTTAEFEEGHLEGARNVPVQDLPARVAEIPRDKPVVVYCRSGGRSSRAAEILRDQGYTVHDLGPMSAW